MTPGHLDFSELDMMKLRSTQTPSFPSLVPWQKAGSGARWPVALVDMRAWSGGLPGQALTGAAGYQMRLLPSVPALKASTPSLSTPTCLSATNWLDPARASGPGSPEYLGMNWVGGKQWGGSFGNSWGGIL